VLRRRAGSANRTPYTTSLHNHPAGSLPGALTGELKSRIDRIWDAFWAGGIANPLEVMEQITYLLFIRRLDDLQTARERKATRAKAAVKNPIFPSDDDADGLPYSDLRWSHFKNMEPGEMYAVLGERVFPSCVHSAARARPTPTTCATRALRSPRLRCSHG